MVHRVAKSWTRMKRLSMHTYGLNACVPPNSYVETLIPNEIVFGGGAFGR